MLRILVLVLLCAMSATAAEQLRLRSPWTTTLVQPGISGGNGVRLSLDVEVPEDAPEDLGIGAYVSDRHGRWFQRTIPGRLKPGFQQLSLSFGATDPVQALDGRWDASVAATLVGGGWFLWSMHRSSAVLRVVAMRVEQLPPAAAALRQIRELDMPAAARTGERWELRCLPDPFPDNPFDPEVFTLDLQVTEPDGTVRTIPGFACQDQQDNPIAAGPDDGEPLAPVGRMRFAVRFRPQAPGVHRLRLVASWKGGTPVAADLPSLNVEGRPWQGMVSVDKEDPRFLTVGGVPWWPVGLNMRSVNDTRCAQRLKTTMTPDLGSRSYASMFERAGKHHIDCAEIWMSAWNLALEWHIDRHEMQGLGRYSQERAWRLDRVLDLAWQHGLRVVLVINNHGQASRNSDREWTFNPLNVANGGPLTTAEEVFHHPRALAAQESMRRYIIARYADHPAIAVWKLWSEHNLTALGGAGDLTVEWHAAAAARWHALDTYRHPVTTHWSGNFRAVNAKVAVLPGMDLLTIDAYHDGNEMLSAILLAGVTNRGGNRSRSVMRFDKPVLITEYGGNWDGAAEQHLTAEHAAGLYLGLICGYAGAPMLWWHEWVEQRDRYQPYDAIASFAAGEVLRGKDAKCIPFTVDGADAGSPRLWCAGWVRPGRILGYLVDEDWISDGRNVPTQGQVRVTIGSSIPAGGMTVEWWDADAGAVVSRQDIAHGGGVLVLTPPPWAKHLAFKLSRKQ